ncbi:hypothetical protein F5Y14DRAFT_62347 [Nemania sp. NC0429]|nr:hypothetical protein F5Y14DRAFT_62347 [Nemania sp. NC0429]
MIGRRSVNQSMIGFFSVLIGAAPRAFHVFWISSFLILLCSLYPTTSINSEVKIPKHCESYISLSPLPTYLSVKMGSCGCTTCACATCADCSCCVSALLYSLISMSNVSFRLARTAIELEVEVHHTILYYTDADSDSRPTEKTTLPLPFGAFVGGWVREFGG